METTELTTSAEDEQEGGAAPVAERKDTRPGDAVRLRLGRAAALLLLLGLAGPAAGQYILVTRQDGTLAALFYCLGIGFFLLALVAERFVQARGSASGRGFPAARVSDRGALAALSGVLMLAAVATVTNPGATGVSLVAWTVSLLLALAAVATPGQLAVLEEARGWRLRWARPRITPELLLFGTITLVGAALRLYDLEGYPSGVHGDEAEFGLIARSILDGRGPNPFGVAFLGDPAMFLFVEAPFVALFGNTIFAIRLFSALTGILTMPAFYLLIRRLFGVRPALLALALLAGSAVHISYSRMALNIPQVELLACVSLYALWRGHRSGSPFWWFSGGVLAALAVYFYFASRILPVVLGVYLLYLLLSQRGKWRATLTGGGLALLGGTMALAPMGVLMASRPGDFITHMTDRLIFGNWGHAAGGAGQGTANPLYVVYQQFRVNLLGFVSIPDAGFYSFAGSPLLSPVLGSLVLLGIVLTLARIRDDRFALLALWFWPVVLVNGVITIDAPQSGRLLQAVFPALAGAALVLDWAMQMGERILSPRLAPVLAVAAALVPVVAGYADNVNFFGPAADARPWEAGIAQARYVASLGPGYRVYGAGMPNVYINHGTTRFLAYNVEATNLHNPAAMLPVAVPPDKDVAFLVYPHMAGYLPLIQSLYPEAEARPQLGRGNQPLFTGIKVPRAEIARWQGLTARYGESTRLESDAGSLGGGATIYPADAGWTGSLFAEREGRYLFQMEGGGSELLVDGVSLGRGREQPLSVGWHSLEMRGRLAGPESRVALKWRPPDQQMAAVAARWLDGRLVGGSLVGRVVAENGQAVERRDRAIGFRNLADLGNTRRPATFTWEGTLKVTDSGRYTINLNSAGEAELALDGKRVLANLGEIPGQRAATATLDLAAGAHSIEVRYSWRQEVGVLELSWAPPGGQPAIVPPEAFGPPSR